MAMNYLPSMIKVTNDFQVKVYIYSITKTHQYVIT